jgi:DNA (cytosine-5)-methyltransferase 1
VGHTVRFVRAFRPAAVLLENVPGMGRDNRAILLQSALISLGYSYRQYNVDASDYGVPQRRRRLVLLALRGRRRALPETLSNPEGIEYVPFGSSVRSAFSELTKVMPSDDPLNVARSLTPTVIARIKSIPIGGTRFDLPASQRLACHNRLDATGRAAATASYGRLKLDGVAPTMTTRCTTPACGSFVHPTEHRGITLREAATLQTFPADYQFAGRYGEIERQIGNAVPIRMAKALGLIVRSLISE